jgi:hypothetical protein
MNRLTLRVRSYTGPHKWYWSLSDHNGVPVADHEVDLDPDDPELKAFTRLSRYLQLNISRASPLSDEAKIIDWVGRWAGEKLFGPIGPALAERTPVAVEVVFPAEAEVLMFRPWELAIVGDQPLARQEVSLVMTREDERRPREKTPVGDRLRMLAVFSLPGDAPALILREQRWKLAWLIDGIRTRQDKAIDLTVLQYDVSRDRLREKLEEGAGWDIVHFSGHGLVDGLVLEGPDGRQQTVPAAELIRLLGIGRDRLKLLVLSSCNSAAAPPDEMLAVRFGQAEDDVLDAADVQRQRALPVLAAEAADRLDCGVLAMRYAVDGDFLLELAEQLYSSMLGSGQPLTRALQLALPRALGDRPRPGVPPLSAGIPALFGRRCLDLTLSPPAGVRDFATGNLKMARFPPEPDHLVGRTGVIGLAARLLGDEAPARTGSKTGIMFTGPAGIGKTTCAVELAYRNENSFGALVEYRVPREGIFGSLREFATQLDRTLTGLRMADEVTSVSRLEVFLPLLTELMERHALLILVDGVDELLTSGGTWRDPSWGRVVDALLKHRGFSRLVLTGRRPPAVVPSGLVVAELEPLTPQESVLLARQLPVLGSLARGTSGIPIEKAKQILATALTAAAGNPGAISAREEELAGTDLARTVPGGAASPEYVKLIDRWTYELS